MLSGSTSLDPADMLYGRINVWARGSPNVRALILTGSRARIRGSLDEFSDYDIEIIAAHNAPPIDDDERAQHRVDRRARQARRIPDAVRTPLTLASQLADRGDQRIGGFSWTALRGAGPIGQSRRALRDDAQQPLVQGRSQDAHQRRDRRRRVTSGPKVERFSVCLGR